MHRFALSAVLGSGQERLRICFKSPYVSGDGCNFAAVGPRALTGSHALFARFHVFHVYIYLGDNFTWLGTRGLGSSLTQEEKRQQFHLRTPTHIHSPLQHPRDILTGRSSSNPPPATPRYRAKLSRGKNPGTTRVHYTASLVLRAQGFKQSCYLGHPFVLEFLRSLLGIEDRTPQDSLCVPALPTLDT
ncbi:hypothetical protein L209DRAFT_473038 [Thermothelomyces heterothallicus CBS 203.75]